MSWVASGLVSPLLHTQSLPWLFAGKPHCGSAQLGRGWPGGWDGLSARECGSVPADGLPLRQEGLGPVADVMLW